MDVAVRTAIVALGSAGLATVLASLPALLSLTNSKLSNRWVGVAISSFLLLPTYVIAGAWSAGFGVQGWWTLSQVSAAKFPTYAIGSVVWIHAMAAIPIAYWLLRIGLRTSLGASIETAKLDGGAVRMFCRSILPAWVPWLIGTTLLIAAWISGDMVVTNLFQVTTLAENCYLKMLSGEPRWLHALTPCLASLLCGLVGGLVFAMLWPRFEHDRSESRPRQAIAGWASRIIAAISWLVVVVAIFLPTCNLVVKAGWVATEVEVGVVQRSWSWVRLFRELFTAPQAFWQELEWSTALSSSATLVAMLLSSIIALFFLRLRSSKSSLFRVACSGVLIAILIGSFSLPGPVVTGLVLSLFQIPWGWLQTLNDRTLIAPILCLQFKLIPLATLVFVLTINRWSTRHRDTWKLDQFLDLSSRMRILARSFWKPIVTIAILLFALAFGELSSYLLCLPPGVTPVSLRIFDLLHYGVRAGEAGLLLFLLGIGAVIGLFVSAELQHDR